MNRKHQPAVRICLLAEIFYPEVKDGLSLHAYQLAECLISKGAELFVITRKMERESKGFELVGNVPVKRIPPVGRLKGKGWKAVVPLMRLLTLVPLLLIKYVNRYDIIMVYGIKILPISAVFVGNAFRKKSVIRIASPSELYEDICNESLKRMSLSKSSPIVKLFRIIRNPFIRRATCFVAISPEIKNQLIDIGIDQRKIFPISNGIDIDKFSPGSEEEKSKLRNKLSLPNDKLIFIYTGRLVLSKGTMLLIKVWRELLQNSNDIHLLLVGSGKGSFDNCEDELNEYINKYKLEKHVTRTGSVDNVNEYLVASNIFVFPSDYEGFGLSIIEALSCALPAVVTRVGVAGDVIQNFKNGILINPKDKHGLKTALEWMLAQRQQWEVMGKKARESAEKYDMGTEANKYIALFEYLMDSKNS